MNWIGGYYGGLYPLNAGLQDYNLTYGGGSKKRLVIHADFAYGESGAGAIAPRSTLGFEVGLLAINEA